jgi:hypothetical protein
MESAFCLNPFFINYQEERCCIICRGTAIHYITSTSNKGKYHMRRGHVCSEICFNMWLMSTAGEGSMSTLRDWKRRYEEDKKGYV